MDMVAYAASFLLGGASALLVMCLLLFFMEHPAKKPRDNQFLKQIANAIEAWPEFKPQEVLQSVGAGNSVASKILPENSLAKDHGAAARRLDMGYNPVPEPL